MKTIGILCLLFIHLYIIFIYYNNKLNNTFSKKSIKYLGINNNIIDEQYNYFKRKKLNDNIYNHKNIDIKNSDFN